MCRPQAHFIMGLFTRRSHQKGAAESVLGLGVLLLGVQSAASIFYLPGVAPKSYNKADQVRFCHVHHCPEGAIIHLLQKGANQEPVVLCASVIVVTTDQALCE
jgi:hypothetical protein